MKHGIILLSLAILTGCVSRPSIQELEAQALQSGDWTAVEARERSLARRHGPGSADACPRGQALVCNDRFDEPRCYCANRNDFSRMIGGW